MYNLEFLRLSVLTEDNFNQTTLMETKLFLATASTTKVQTGIMSHGSQLVIAICLIIVWKISVVIFISSFCKFIRNSKLSRKRFREVPCSNCRYFNKSHYLKCAVHPSNVLTKEAINCSDYWSHSRINKSGSADDHLF